MCKRIVDIVVSLFALLVFFPIMILVAVLLVLDSRGPVIFSQMRVGLNGSLFRMYKFRSMFNNAQQEGPHFTSPSDTRVTRVGKFIRKTSLDELPQLLNVFFGNMSLVGPRPNVEVQKNEYTDEEWDKRNSVKPGITGLAQATLRSAATSEQRKELDLEYVDKISVVLDIKIIVLTFNQLLFRGSH